LGGDDPTIVVHGDHGEAFGEHGTYGHEPYLHEENVRVPLVVDSEIDGTVSDVTSLRRLPELLETLAVGSTGRFPAEPFGVARTRDGDSVSISTPRTNLIQATNGQNGTARATDGGELEPLADRFRAHLDEQQAVERSIQPVCSEESL
jgi:arylsulfatase